LNGNIPGTEKILVSLGPQNAKPEMGPGESTRTLTSIHFSSGDVNWHSGSFTPLNRIRILTAPNVFPQLNLTVLVEVPGGEGQSTI
jgi:hypothetical protein